MAPRPYWKGYLKLSLVSCAVALYPAASKSERVSFHWLNRETGNRLRQLMVDSDSNKPVGREDRVRGFPIARHDYVEIEEEDLEAVEIESSHTIDIERFAPKGEIDPIYLGSSYYLIPNDKPAEEAFAVICDAMAAEGVAGIGRAVISRRERLLVMEPRGKGVLATMLHYGYEVNSDRAYFDAIPNIEIPAEMLKLARHIIRTKMGHFDISKFEDRYENALVQMIRAKQAGRPSEPAKVQQTANVIDLMDALRRSATAEKGSPEEREPAALKEGPRKPGGKTGKDLSGPAASARRRAVQSKPEPAPQLRRESREHGRASSSTGTRKLADRR
jgi:DNA end-binding protein Ku